MDFHDMMKIIKFYTQIIVIFICVMKDFHVCNSIKLSVLEEHRNNSG